MLPETVPGTYKYLWVGGCCNHCYHYQCHHGDDDNADFLKAFIYLFIFGCKGSSLLGHSLVAESRGYSLPSMLRILIAMASLVAEHRL